MGGLRYRQQRRGAVRRAGGPSCWRPALLSGRGPRELLAMSPPRKPAPRPLETTTGHTLGSPVTTPTLWLWFRLSGVEGRAAQAAPGPGGHQGPGVRLCGGAAAAAAPAGQGIAAGQGGSSGCAGGGRPLSSSGRAGVGPGRGGRGRQPVADQARRPGGWTSSRPLNALRGRQAGRQASNNPRVAGSACPKVRAGCWWQQQQQ